MLRPPPYFFCLALALACGTTSSVPRPSSRAAGEEPGRRLRFTVVGTNDLHGWVFPHRAMLGDGIKIEQGGVSTFAGYLADLRAENPGGIVLLDAGDLFQGTLAANLTQGAVVIEAYNYLGYAAAAIGNHEFDYGPEGSTPSSSRSPGDPYGALKARIGEAKFPLLAANIYEARTGGRPDWLKNDGTALMEVKGVQIGILGLVTPSTPQTTNPVNVRSLRFGSLVPEAISGAKSLRRRGAQLVILVVHAGGKCTEHANQRDLSSCERDGEIFELLQELPPRTFDAVVAGHTHQAIGHFVNEMPVIETWGLGRHFGTIDLFFDLQTQEVLRDRTLIQAVIPVCALVDRSTQECDANRLEGRNDIQLVPATFLGHRVIPDAALERMLEPTRQKVASLQNQELGLKVASPLTRNFEAESTLGDFIADSLREMERADVSLLNAGGLRADIPAGNLTYGRVYEVLPFDNTVATLVMSGDQLSRLVRTSYGAKKGVFQVSGLKIKLSKCPGKSRVREIALDDGGPVAPARLYRVVLPDFLARGGDGLGSVIATLPPGRVDLGTNRELNFREALIQYWKEKARVLQAPRLGRLTFVAEDRPCQASASPGGEANVLPPETRVLGDE